MLLIGTKQTDIPAAVKSLQLLKSSHRPRELAWKDSEAMLPSLEQATPTPPYPSPPLPSPLHPTSTSQSPKEASVSGELIDLKVDPFRPEIDNSGQYDRKEAQHGVETKLPLTQVNKQEETTS